MAVDLLDCAISGSVLSCMRTSAACYPHDRLTCSELFLNTPGVKRFRQMNVDGLIFVAVACPYSLLFRFSLWAQQRRHFEKRWKIMLGNYLDGLSQLCHTRSASRPWHCPNCFISARFGNEWREYRSTVVHVLLRVSRGPLPSIHASRVQEELFFSLA